MKQRYSYDFAPPPIDLTVSVEHMEAEKQKIRDERMIAMVNETSKQTENRQYIRCSRAKGTKR